jgi:Metallo-peptidase family M12/Secretion system C-terminal sorting domain/Two component regulator propeller
MKKHIQNTLIFFLFLSISTIGNAQDNRVNCGLTAENLDESMLKIIQSARADGWKLARKAAENFREVRIAIVVDSTVYFQYNKDTVKIKEAAYRNYRTASAYYERDFNVRFNVVAFEFLTKNKGYNEKNNTFGAFNKILADYQNRTDIKRDILIVWSVALKEPYGGVANGIGTVGTNAIIHMLSYGTNEPSMGTILHEIGHSMGSVHTQSCTWAGGPFEVCTDVEGACKGWAIDSRYASIMSYCSDGDLVFHPLCKDVIQKVVNPKFTPVATLPSAAPVLHFPKNNVTEFYPSDFFQWKWVEKISNYQVVISENADFSKPLIDSLVTDNMIYVDKTLKRNTVYYWRVRAKNQVGDGAWSATSTFKTNTNLILKAPLMESILDDKTYENKVIAFRKVADAKEYSIEIHKGTTITNTSLFSEKKVTSNRVRIETILPAISANLNTQYTFRVRAISDTSKSVWSNPTKEYFFYGLKMSVTNNSVRTPVSPLLSTYIELPRSSQKRTYDYEISKTSDFKTVDVKKTVKYDSYFQVPNVDTYASFVLENLTPNQQYYYRLKAKNEADSTNTWTTGTFTTSYESRWTPTHAGNSILPFGASTQGLFVDSKNNKWFFGNQGVFRKSPDGKIEQFTRERTSDLLANTVSEMAEDEQGRIWFATSDGVTKFENGLFTRYESLLWGTVIALGKSVDRDMYNITTGKNGVNYAYTSTGKVIKFQNGFWTNINGNNTFIGSSLKLRQDANSNLWVVLYNYSTSKNSFKIYDGSNWSDYQPNWSFLSDGSSSNIDSKGNIWYINYSKDSIYVVKDKNSYKSYFKTIKAIDEFSNQEISVDLRSYFSQITDTGTKIYFFSAFGSSYIELEGTTYRYKYLPQTATGGRSYYSKMFTVDKNDAVSYIHNSSVIYEQNKTNIIANFTDKQTFASCNVKFRIGVAYPPTGDATTTKLKVMLSDGTANTFKDITATYANGEITAKIPANTPVGKGYRIKFAMGGDWYVSNESPVLEVVASPTASVTGTNQFCTGATTSLTANVSAAKAPFAYAWYSGTSQTTDVTDKITISKSGDYSVIITDANGCLYSSQAFKITEKPETATIGGANQYCVGSTTTLSANAVGGKAPFTYSWQLGTTNLTDLTSSISIGKAGDYGVVVTDGTGCKFVSQPLKITEKGVAASITPDGQTTVYQPNTVKLNANTVANASYQWQKNTTDIAGATAANLEAKESGDYTVSLKSDGCTSVSGAVKVAIEILLASGVPLNAQEMGIEVFPNPTEQSVILSLGKIINTKTNAELIDSQGKTFFQQEIKEEKTTISLQAIPAGTYFIRVLQGDKVLVKKIIKN